MISIGLVGCGQAGCEHLLAYQYMPNVEVKGIYDQDLGRAQALAEEFGTLSLGFEELVQKVDLVDICTPTKTHVEIIRQVENVRGILCEDPLAPNLQEAKAILEYCEQKGIALFPVQRSGLRGPLAKIRELLVNNTRPPTGMIRITRRGHSIANDISIAQEKRIFLDALFKDFAFLLKMIGPIERIYASSSLRPGSNEVYALVSLKFTNGSIAHLNANLLEEPGGEDLEFAYPGGLITYSEHTASPLRFSYRRQGGATGSPSDQGACAIALKNIIAATLSQTELFYTPEDSLRALEAALGAAESSRTRQVMNLGPARGRSDG